MDQEQVEFERDIRRKVAIVASVFGALFLFLSISSGEPSSLPPTETYRVLWVVSTVATTITVVVSYVRRRGASTVAIVQTVLSFATLLLALLFASDCGVVAIGPSGAASIMGSLLIAWSASARIRWVPRFSCE